MREDSAGAGARFLVVLHPDEATFEQRSSVADSLADRARAAFRA
jgi:hypothetical protein